MKQIKRSKSTKKTKMLWKSQSTGNQIYSASVTRKSKIERSRDFIPTKRDHIFRDSCGYIHSFKIGFEKNVSNFMFVDGTIYNLHAPLHKYLSAAGDTKVS